MIMSKIKNLKTEMNCPFCAGSGVCLISNVKSRSKDEKELIAKFLKIKGMSVKGIAEWMGYSSKRSVELLLSRGTVSLVAE